MEIINATDGYKLGHHRMYPEGTEGSVVFGIQYLIKKYLIDEFNQNFFGLPKEKAVNVLSKSS